MSGLLALLDDVAAIAKVAASSVDDVIGQATKAGAKAAGAVIDDAAVTPKYVHGFDASRELPIVFRIARGSIFNKLVILLPAALLLSTFAPWLIAPLLLLGGAYLCYEGAEKVHHWMTGDGHAHGGRKAALAKPGTPAQLEEEKVRGAIKTDFILSAEIMTIALAALETDSIIFRAIALAIVAVAITVIVYGAVALIVKADDIGLHMSTTGSSAGIRTFGAAIVRGMPGFLTALTIVGTVAMLWVGGSIIIHALAGMGWHGPEELIALFGKGVGQGSGFVTWLAKAIVDGVLGLLIGLALMPLIHRAVGPIIGALRSYASALK